MSRRSSWLFGVDNGPWCGWHDPPCRCYDPARTLGTPSPAAAPAAGGGYEQACRARLAKILARKRTTTRLAVHFAFHTGYYSRQTNTLLSPRDTPTQKARPATRPTARPAAARRGRQDHGRRRPAVDARRDGRQGLDGARRSTEDSLSPLVSTSTCAARPDLMASEPATVSNVAKSASGSVASKHRRASTSCSTTFSGSRTSR